MVFTPRCPLLFLLGPLLVFWGICVLGTSLGTFAVTTSFLKVFPFGAPLWTGVLFLLLGCVILGTFYPSEHQHTTVSSSRALIWFTVSVSVLATLECLLAISLFLWYRSVISPALQRCFSVVDSISSPPSTSTCDCSRGFIDPPSLSTTIHTFVGVSDCSLLGNTLDVFYWVILGLYSVGVILSTSVGLLAGRKLRSSGKSGVYAVTPVQTAFSPDLGTLCQTFEPSTTHPVPPGSSPSVSGLPSFILTQRCASQTTTLSSLHNNLPARAPCHSSPVVLSNAPRQNATRSPQRHSSSTTPQHNSIRSPQHNSSRTSQNSSPVASRSPRQNSRSPRQNSRLPRHNSPVHSRTPQHNSPRTPQHNSPRTPQHKSLRSPQYTSPQHGSPIHLRTPQHVSPVLSRTPQANTPSTLLSRTPQHNSPSSLSRTIQVNSPRVPQPPCLHLVSSTCHTTV